MSDDKKISKLDSLSDAISEFAKKKRENAEPSQPSGAREWLFEHAPLAWNGPNRVAHIVSWMEAYARQQTAAKDAEIADLRRQRDFEWDSRKAASSGRIAAERERDSLREFLASEIHNDKCDCLKCIRIRKALKAGKTS